MTEPPLSVVVATTRPWPEVRACLDSLHDQAAAAGAEIVLGHHGDGFPDAVRERYPAVAPFTAPGASANELRGLALGHTRAPVVAVTEDHCVVTPGWCETILEAHRAHPEAAAIGGAVENGATRRAIDRAAFFLGNARAMLPIADGPAEHLAGQANVAYKRWALPAEVGAAGLFELDHNAELARRGEVLVADSRLVVFHDQSLGFRGTCGIWFHASRSFGGMRAREMGPLRRLGRVLVTPLAHPVQMALHFRDTWAKRRRRRQILAVAPLMMLLAGMATLGVTVGYATGQGDSPRHIR